MTQTADIGDENIRALQTKAGHDGNRELYALCEIALNPGPNIPETAVRAARMECAAIISPDLADSVISVGHARDAQLRAEVRDDWFVMLRGAGHEPGTAGYRDVAGPYSKTVGRMILRAHVAAGGTGQLLHVAEDYLE